MSVAVLGTGWDAHVLPPIDETKNAPVSLVALSSSDEVAQAIRSEIERCAFEVCLALGLRDFALVRLVWDGARCVWRKLKRCLLLLRARHLR